MKLFDTELTNDERKFFITDDFFEEIILGLNISKSDEADIISIAKRKRIPIYKVEKQKKSFLFAKTLITP